MTDEGFKAVVKEAVKLMVEQTMETIAAMLDETAAQFETGALPELGSGPALRNFAKAMRSASAKQFPRARA